MWANCQRLPVTIVPKTSFSDLSPAYFAERDYIIILVRSYLIRFISFPYLGHPQDVVISDPAVISKPSYFARALALLPWAVFWALAGQGVLSITRFFSKMVVGGRFGSEEAGMGSVADLAYYDAAFGIMLLFVALHEAFVTTPLTFFNHREKKTVEQKFAGKMFTLSLAFSIFSLVAMLVVIWYQSTLVGVSRGFVWAMVALTALLPFQMVKEFSKRWLLANLQVRQSTILELGFAASFAVLIGMLIYFAKVNAATVFGITLIANAICLAGWWFVYGKSFSMAGDGLKNQAVENFSYGKWIAGENVCSVLMMYFSQWFLISKIGEELAGVYSACYTIVFMANPFLLGVSGLFAPRVAQVFSQQGWKGMFPILRSYAAFVVFVLVCFSGVLFLFGDSLTLLAFGDKYAKYFVADEGGYNAIPFLLSMAMPCFGLSFLLTCCILAADKPIYCFYAAVVGMVVAIVMNLSFAQPNLHTASISFVGGAFSTMAFRAVVVWRLYRNYKLDLATEISTAEISTD